MSEMEVKPGYKQTEVGVIPEDWDLFAMHKICKNITDGEHLTPKRAKRGIYLLSARNVYDGYLSLDDVDFFLEPEYLKFKKRVDPKDGDLLITCSGTIGRVCVVPINLKFGLVRSVAIIKPIEEYIDSYYLMFICQFDIVQKQIQKTLNQLAQANLFQGQIRQLLITCPKKKEQTAIATALSDVDALISGLDRLIKKKRAIKQAAMEELLTGKRRLPGFDSGKGYKQTEVGEIPEDWEIVNLNDLVKFSNGKAHENYIRNNGKYIVVNSKFISTEGTIKKYSDDCFCPAEPNDILMVMSDVPNGKAIAKSFFVEESDAFTVNQRICVLTPKKVHGKLLFYKLNRNPYYLSFDDGVKQTNLRKQDILSCPLVIPHLYEEQTAIATVLSDMDTEISALEARRAKTLSLKQGMMQELLTGRIRLV